MTEEIEVLREKQRELVAQLSRLADTFEHETGLKIQSVSIARTREELFRLQWQYDGSITEAMTQSWEKDKQGDHYSLWLVPHAEV